MSKVPVAAQTLIKDARAGFGSPVIAEGGFHADAELAHAGSILADSVVLGRATLPADTVARLGAPSARPNTQDLDFVGDVYAASPKAQLRAEPRSLSPGIQASISMLDRMKDRFDLVRGSLARSGVGALVGAEAEAARDLKNGLTAAIDGAGELAPGRLLETWRARVAALDELTEGGAIAAAAGRAATIMGETAAVATSIQHLARAANYAT